MPPSTLRLADAFDLGEAARQAAQRLSAGQVVALPTDSIYGLHVQAGDPAALSRLWSVKGRPENRPPVVLVPDLDTLTQAGFPLSPLARRLADRFWPGPLTLVLPAPPGESAWLPGRPTDVAVRWPDHDLLLAVMQRLGRPILSTSANRSGQPPLTDATVIAATFADEVALVVDGGPPRHPTPSTLVGLTGHPPRILRPGAIPLAELDEYISASPPDPP